MGLHYNGGFTESGFNKLAVSALCEPPVAKMDGLNRVLTETKTWINKLCEL